MKVTSNNSVLFREGVITWLSSDVVSVPNLTSSADTDEVSVWYWPNGFVLHSDNPELSLLVQNSKIDQIFI